jgi:hypothetical protein
MSLRVTFRLALLVASLGGLLWLAERRFLSERPDQTTTQRLVPFSAEDVLGLEIRRGDAVAMCVRRGDDWWMEQPLATRADRTVVARLLGVMESLVRTETVTERQRLTRNLTLADYGLEPPSAVVRFSTAVGTFALAVGGVPVMGDTVYVRSMDKSDVFATSSALLEALPGGPDALRDRSLLRGEPFRTVRVDVTGAGFAKLARVGAHWVFQQPVRFRADGAAVNGLLEAIYGLRADRFVWDPSPRTNVAGGTVAPVRVETYGLSDDEAAMRIAVWTAGDEAGQELIIGKSLPEDAARAFARLRGSGSVFAVSRQAADRCRISVQELMDRDVFPCSAGDVRQIEIRRQDKLVTLARKPDKGWMLLEPVQWQADTQTVLRLVQNMVNLKVAGFLEGVAGDPKSLGLAPPWCSVAISNGAPTQAADGSSAEVSRGVVPMEILMISSVPPKDGLVLARFESGDTVFRLPADILSWLGSDPVDPLAYRDRQILAIPPEAVNRISLVRGGVEQSVARGATGAWEAVSPPGQTANEETVAEILVALASLRALRIEYHGPENTEAYGFDRTATTLTVGISSGEGIRKTLLLGYRAGTDGRFAMVQGQDVIFALEKGLAERLTAELVRPVRSDKSASQ